jgi:ribosomal protein S27E
VDPRRDGGKDAHDDYCSDDFAFVAPEGVFAPTKCMRCRNSDVVIAVDAALVRTIARYLADPER